MTETLKIIYDIFAGMGMFVTVLVLIAFFYGLLITKRANATKARETEALLAKLNPELKKKEFARMMAELEKESQTLEEKQDDELKTKGG